MTTDVQELVRRAFDHIIDAAGDLGPCPSSNEEMLQLRRAALTSDAESAPRAPQWEGPKSRVATRRSSLRWVTIAASVIVVAAMGTVAFLVTRSDDPATIDGAPTPETTVTAPSIDPQWSPMASPSIEPRSGYVSVQTDNGWFVWSGWTKPSASGEGTLNDGAYYDGASDTWTTLPEAPITNDFQSGIGVWTGTEVIVVVAYEELQLAAFDPATFTWRDIPVSDDLRAMWPQRDGHFSRGWPRVFGGKLVMLLPDIVTGRPALLIVDPSTGEWTTGAPSPMISDNPVIGVAASSDQFFIVGAGQRSGDFACSGESTPLFIYDVTTDTWNTTFLPHGNWQPAVVAWTGTHVLAAGGQMCGSETVMRTTSLFDPVTSTWSDMADMTDDMRQTLVVPVVSDGRVIVAGESGRPSVYYIDSDAWWSGPALVLGREFGDLHLAVTTGRVMTWAASPLEPQDDGSFSCCTPDPAARALAIPSSPPEASPTPATPVAPTTPVSVAAVSTMRPLELADAPEGLKLVWQGIRPAAGQDLRAAVFVKRDAQDHVVDRVVARVGGISLHVGDRAISPPPNLATATSGDIYIDSRTVRVEYALGVLGNLALDGFHVDERADPALAEQMQALAAALDVADGKGIGVIGQLPAGWELATAGVEPEQNAASLFQAFDVDMSDGVLKVTVENRASNDAGYPYWMMGQTLEPAQIRGHDGFVTTQPYHSDAGPPGAPTVANPTSSATTLIWEETPGHWVTMWVADQTTEEAFRLANALVAIDQSQWHLPGASESVVSSTSLVSP